MGIYLIAGFLLALLCGAIAKSVLKAQKKWTDTFTFLWIGIAFGIILLLFRSILGIWYVETWVSISIGTIAIVYTYFLFYKDFKEKFPGANVGILKFMHLKVSSGKVTFQEVSAEDAISDVARDLFSSDRVKEMTKDLHDNTEEGAFWGWSALLLNGMIFVGTVAGVATQVSLDSFFTKWFAELSGNSDFKVLFWILIVMGGIVLIGKILGFDKD